MRYRLYKKLNDRWEKTSFAGDLNTIYKIWRTLSHSNVWAFDIRIERGLKMSNHEFYSLLNLLKILDGYRSYNLSIEYNIIIDKLCNVLEESLEEDIICGMT